MVRRRTGKGDDPNPVGDPADEPDVIELLRQAVAMFDAATPFDRGTPTSGGALSNHWSQLTPPKAVT